MNRGVWCQRSGGYTISDIIDNMLNNSIMRSKAYNYPKCLYMLLSGHTWNPSIC